MSQVTPLEAWLQSAIAQAERRGLPALAPLLEGLARATRALRSADFNEDPRGSFPEPDANRQA